MRNIFYFPTYFLNSDEDKTAIANAIYHATGKRIRDLPITPDKLL
jgi:hypothetical protein